MLVIGDDETMMMLSQSFGKKTSPVKFECLSLGETAENMETHSFTCGNIDNLELNFVFKYIIDPYSLCLGFKSQRLETLREYMGSMFQATSASDQGSALLRVGHLFANSNVELTVLKTNRFNRT